MKFRIEAYKGTDRYRLQEDGSWRKLEKSRYTKNNPDFCREDEPDPNDKLHERLGEAGKFISSTDKITIDGVTYEVERGGRTLGKRSESVELHPIVYRVTKPRHFSVRELESTIRMGDDGEKNILILNLRGFFGLTSLDEALYDFAPIAVRHESLPPDGLGFDAARDIGYINGLYRTMLEGWSSHLMVGELNVFMDMDYNNKSVKELWHQAEDLTSHLKK